MFFVPKRGTLQGINISHLGKRKIIFKMPFLGDMLVPWRVTNSHPFFYFPPLLTWEAPPQHNSVHVFFCPIRRHWQWQTLQGAFFSLPGSMVDWYVYLHVALIFSRFFYGKFVGKL